MRELVTCYAKNNSRFLLQDSNDFSNIQLTPEQQRQLELIEKMPLLKETHPGDSTFMSPDLGDPDLGGRIISTSQPHSSRKGIFFFFGQKVLLVFFFLHKTYFADTH